MTIFCSCQRVPQRIKKNFHLCYNGKNISSNNLDFNGYYAIKQVRDSYGINMSKEHRMDTLYINFMFYPDGFFVYNFGGNPNATKQYLKSCVTDKKENFWFNNSGYWGLYSVKNDTIKVQYLNHPAPLAPPWIGIERWFKIINKSQLQEIRIINLDSRDGKANELQSKSSEAIANFIPVLEKPEANSWLKKEKWIWCERSKK